jgi:hypothetical protein
LGTNDAKTFNWFDLQANSTDSYVLDYLNFIQAARALASKPKIYLMTLVPLYSPFPYDMNSTVINDFISNNSTGLVTQMAALAGVDGVIDIHAAFSAALNASCTCDGCHPTDVGYTFIGQYMAPIIQAAAKERFGSVPESPRLSWSSEQLEEYFLTEEYQDLSKEVNKHATKGSIKF